MATESRTSPFNQSYVGPRPDVLALVPAEAKLILDVGCSDGALGLSIKGAFPGATVIGMEMSEAMARVAASRIDKVIVGNIESLDAFSQIEDMRFDVIVVADILEHLGDPWAVLRKVRSCLRPNGVVVASIPNVRHIDTIFNLVCRGEWPYRDRGIHDRTHLRFFTKKNILQMFRGADYRIERIETNYRLIERPHRVNRYAKFFALPGIAPFIAFQYLLVASVANKLSS